MKNIYLDHAATTPMHEEVAKTMFEHAFVFGNPSSIHSQGREARKYIDQARETIAKTLNANGSEIIFTSGGTEADNMAIIGAAMAAKEKGNHVITSQIEHHAVLHAFEYLEKQGFEVTYLPVNEKGAIEIETFKNALRDDTILVSIMYGNNEVGTIQPIQAIGEILQSHQAVFHTDAVQAYGMLPIDVKASHIDLLSISAHKINGPKGVGALYQRKTVKLQPISYGGSQERKRRAGTENVQSIIGFAKAAELMDASRENKAAQYKKWKQQLVDTWKEGNVDFSINGDVHNGLPHVLNVSFSGAEVETLLIHFDMNQIAVSSGSACTAGSINPSHVLSAIYPENAPQLRNSVRFSFGLHLTDEQINYVAEKTATILGR